MTKHISKLVASTVMALALSSLATVVNANLITNGFTFSVATDGVNTNYGNHFHSNTGGSFGNPAGKAEVGRFTGEEVRGLSEYDLSSQAAALSAFVTFDVYKVGGLFNGDNDTPFTGNIFVDAYEGNNSEDISDYQAGSIGTVGSFFLSSGSVMAGDIFSFDILSIYNMIILNGGNSLGIRLVEDRTNADYNSGKAWTFQDFRLTTDNQCVGGGCISSVPEPASLVLIGLGLVGIAVIRRKFK